MKITRNGVHKLVQEEMRMANEEFPMFHSDHEGLCVIEEEIFELSEDYKALMSAVRDIKMSVFKDQTDTNKQICASHITLIAIELACEAIQVAAMGNKFNVSIGERKENING